MLVCDGVHAAAMDDAGLMAGYYYDPYPPRFQANLKEILAAGSRVLVRLHAGVRYPMDEDSRVGVVDREGHAVAVVGFEDDRFLLADPWDTARMGGRDGGLRAVDHRDLAMRWVNSSRDKAILVFPLPIALSTASLGNRTSTLRANVSLRAPVPQVRLGATLLEDLAASIRLPEGLELLTEQRRRIPIVGPGETISFSWEVREHGDVDGEVRVGVVGLATGTDPYPFRDVVGSQAVARLQSVGAREHADEPSIAAT